MFSGPSLQWWPISFKKPLASGRNAAILLGLLASFLLTPRLSFQFGTSQPDRLAEFYTVDVWDDDFYPYWQSAVLHVTRMSEGVKLEYIHIESANLPCNDPAVRGATVSLPNTGLEELTNGVSLCSLDASAFNQTVESYTRKLEPFSTARSAVVAICGQKGRVFKMPRFKMNEKLIREKEQTVERMSQLTFYLLKRAFPGGKIRDISWGIDPSLRELPPDSPELEALKSGRFDAGYWIAFDGMHPAIPAQVVPTVDPTIGSDSDLGKLHNVLSAYKHPYLGLAGRTGVLVDSEGYKLKEFVAPPYSPLSVQAGVGGKVTLSLTVNRLTGRVENAQALSGHPLLLHSSIESARQWQFDSAQALPGKINAVLEFSIHCGG